MFLFIVCGALGGASVTVINHSDSNCQTDNWNCSAQNLSKWGAVWRKGEREWRQKIKANKMDQSLTWSFIPGLGVQRKSCCRSCVWLIAVTISWVTKWLIKFRTKANPFRSSPECVKSKKGFPLGQWLCCKTGKLLIQISDALVRPERHLYNRPALLSLAKE